MVRPHKETISSMLRRGIQRKNSREPLIATAKVVATMLPLPARPRDSWEISDHQRETKRGM